MLCVQEVPEIRVGGPPASLPAEPKANMVDPALVQEATEGRKAAASLLTQGKLVAAAGAPEMGAPVASVPAQDQENLVAQEALEVLGGAQESLTAQVKDGDPSSSPGAAEASDEVLVTSPVPNVRKLQWDPASGHPPPLILQRPPPASAVPAFGGHRLAAQALPASTKGSLVAGIAPAQTLAKAAVPAPKVSTAAPEAAKPLRPAPATTWPAVRVATHRWTAQRQKGQQLMQGMYRPPAESAWKQPEEYQMRTRLRSDAAAFVPWGGLNECLRAW
mmetsp:Transcript_69887/g.211430  ORF Transcript_69887/g.211430 Transcript_69887/m.211430 type:complete len:275 (-) Transcript_69887:160-984(-)